MKSLFLRLYLLLIFTFIGLGWSIDKIYDSYAIDTDLTTDIELHKGTFFLLNRELKRLPESNQVGYLSAISKSFGYPVNLQPSSNLAQEQAFSNYPLTDAQLNYLQQGGIATVFDDLEGKSWFLQKLTESEQVIVLGPVLHEAADRSGVIYMAVFLIGLALIVFIWAWPISRGLIELTRAATAFGQGNFSIRASLSTSAPLSLLVERFNGMAGRIQRLLKSHKDLSHAVSHELRTPIARIRFAMAMVREVDEPQAREKYLDTMDNNIEELDALVDELLTYARFDREEPQLNLETIELAELTHRVIDKFKLTEPHFEFNVLADPTLKNKQCVCSCDVDAISRILDNLVRNAVRYAESSIMISFGYHDDNVFLQVADDGPGIPEESRQQLFDPFVRLDQSRDRKSGGIGLGLAIVKRYIELHQGTVKIDRSSLNGAQFTLTWPHLQ